MYSHHHLTDVRIGNTQVRKSSVPHDNTGAGLNTLSNRVDGITTHQNGRQSVRALIITHNVKHTHHSMIKRLTNLLLHRSIHRNGNSTVQTYTIAILSTLTGLHVNVRMPIRLKRTRIIGMSADGKVFAQIVQVKRQNISIRLLSDILLIVIFRPHSRTTLFNATLGNTSGLHGVSVTSATGSLIRNDTNSKYGSTIQLLSQVIPMRVIRRSLYNINTISGHSIKRQRIASRTRRVLRRRQISARSTIGILTVLEFPRNYSALQITKPVEQVNVTQIMRIAIITRRHLVLFISTLSYLVLTRSGTKGGLTGQRLTINSQGRTLQATGTTTNAGLSIIRNMRGMITHLTINTRRLQGSKNSLLHHIGHTIRNNGTILNLVSRLNRLKGVDVTGTLSLLINTLRRLQTTKGQVNSHLRHKRIGRTILGRLTKHNLQGIVNRKGRHVTQSVKRNISRNTNHVSITTVRQSGQDHHPRQTQNLHLRTITGLVGLLHIIERHQGVTQHSLILGTASGLSNLLHFALCNLYQIGRRGTTYTGHGRGRHSCDNGGNTNIALFTFTLTVTVASRAIENQAQQDITAMIRTGVMVVFLKAQTHGLNATVVRTNRHTDLKNANMGHTGIAHGPHTANEKDVINNLTNVGITNNVYNINDAYIIHECQEDPTQLQHKNYATHGSVPSYATNLFHLLELLMRDNGRHHLTQKRTLAKATLSDTTQHTNLADPIQAQQGYEATIVTTLGIVADRGRVLTVRSR